MEDINLRDGDTEPVQKPAPKPKLKRTSALSRLRQLNRRLFKRPLSKGISKSKAISKLKGILNESQENKKERSTGNPNYLPLVLAIIFAAVIIIGGYIAYTEYKEWRSKKQIEEKTREFFDE